MNKIKEFFEDILNSLRDTAYAHSEERREFAKTKLLAHKFYMDGFRKTSPYLHPDTWQEDREGELSNME